MGTLNMANQERKYIPEGVDINNQSSQSYTTQMLTADEKVQELKQMLDDRNLENDEMKVQLE